MVKRSKYPNWNYTCFAIIYTILHLYALLRAQNDTLKNIEKNAINYINRERKKQKEKRSLAIEKMEKHIL